MQVIVNYFRFGMLMLMAILPCCIYAANSSESSKENSLLTIPEDFNVLYVDGHKFQHNFFSPGGAELELSMGEHRVVMVYDQFFERGDDTDRIKSEPFILSFVIATPAEYELGFVVPKTLDAGKDFAKNPQVEILIPTTKSVLPTQVALNIDKELYLASYATAFENPVLPAHSSQTEVSASQGNATEIAEVKILLSKPPVQQQSVSKGTNALQQLQYWWQQADQGQRDEFLKGIKTRP